VPLIIARTGPQSETGQQKFEIEIRVARFFLAQHTKTGNHVPNDHKMYQMAIKYSKWSQNIPNGLKIFQMVSKYIKWS
jgi:hypothetical protein